MPSAVGTLSVAAGSLSPTLMAMGSSSGLDWNGRDDASSREVVRELVERVDHRVAHGDRERLETIAAARAGDAVPVLHAEERAVRRAQDEALLAVHELVGRPVERRPDVRAAVHVRADGAAAPDHEDADARAADREAASLAVRDLVDTAERRALRLGHAVSRARLRSPGRALDPTARSAARSARR